MESLTINGMRLNSDGSISGTVPSYSSSYSGTITDQQALAVLAGILGFILLVALALTILEIIGKWKVFKKADKPGWHAIIPFLNTYDLFEIGGQKGIYFLFMFIPVVGTLITSVFTILAYYNITRAFNRSKWYLVGLTIIPFVFYLILGFNKDKFDRRLVVDDESEMANQPIAQTRAA